MVTLGPASIAIISVICVLAVIALVGGLRTFGLLLGHTIPRLELEAAFAGCVGQRFHAAVISKT